MAAQTLDLPDAIEHQSTPPAEHRAELHQLVSRLVQMRSTITAFKLAAEADRHEAPALYWPDLMKALGDMLPDEERAQELVNELLRDLARAARMERPGPEVNRP